MDMAGITTAFTTAVAGIGDNVLDFAVIALPVGLGIVGLFFGVKYGIKFFKKLSGNA